MAAALTFDRLRAVALRAGIEHLGCTSADPLDSTRRVLEERRGQGLNGTMQFTYKNPARSTDPRATLPVARSVLVGALSYHRLEPPAPTGGGPVARVARYVWADDQERLLQGLETVAEELRAVGHRAVVLSDQNHLVDRAVAHRAGIGWFGKNANLLVPGAGSWFVIGSVLTDAELSGSEVSPSEVSGSDETGSELADGVPAGAIWGGGSGRTTSTSVPTGHPRTDVVRGDAARSGEARRDGGRRDLALVVAGSGAPSGARFAAPPTDRPAERSAVPDGCGPCTRCMPACPTRAIVAPGVVDARLCLSWTLQSTGVFPVEQRVAVGDRIYGCDECQDVCPPNRREELRVRPGRPGRPVRLDRVGDPDRAWVPILDLLESADGDVMERYGRWYVPERDARYLRRNALVVLGNTGDGTDPRTRAVLAACLRHGDPLVRAHAVWSARRLGCDDLAVDLATDPDPMVQEELTRPVARSAGAEGAAPSTAAMAGGSIRTVGTGTAHEADVEAALVQVAGERVGGPDAVGATAATADETGTTSGPA